MSLGPWFCEIIRPWFDNLQKFCILILKVTKVFLPICHISKNIYYIGFLKKPKFFSFDNESQIFTPHKLFTEKYQFVITQGRPQNTLASNQFYLQIQTGATEPKFLLGSRLGIKLTVSRTFDTLLMNEVELQMLQCDKVTKSKLCLPSTTDECFFVNGHVFMTSEYLNVVHASYGWRRRRSLLTTLTVGPCVVMTTGCGCDSIGLSKSIAQATNSNVEDGVTCADVIL